MLPTGWPDRHTAINAQRRAHLDRLYAATNGDRAVAYATAMIMATGGKPPPPAIDS